MQLQQPLTSEGEYLLYLLGVSEARGLGTARGVLGYLIPHDGVDTVDRDAAYALGRIRESLAGRINRLPRGGEHDFLVGLIAQCQGEDGAAAPPRWPASALGTVVGMIRTRLFASRSRAA